MTQPLPRRLTVVDRPTPTGDPLSVLLVTEATYPFAMGGVSTWCDQLVSALPEVTFHLTALVADPDVEPRFVLPPNVASLHTQPLWGVSDPKESWHNATLGQVVRPRLRTTDDVIRTQFVPRLSRMLELILFASLTDAAAELPDVIADLYSYLQRYDYVRSARHTATWEALSALLLRAAEEARVDLGQPQPSLAELTTAAQWVCRWLFPLAIPIPRVDVVHLAMAGSCSLVAAAAAREHGSAILLTEHGVYLRERYLAERGRREEYFLKLLGLRFARAITAMTYALADQISPCCDFNQEWERRLGAHPGKLVTVYYGLPGERFAEASPIAETPHTVVWLGRINPLKDLETLLRAAAIVQQSRPDVVFRLYGGAAAEDRDYERRCHELHEELGLGDAVVWAGVTSDSAAAFATGDLVVLSSISEGFPYSTLEAMLSGRAVVATNVGGLTEQIGACGQTVEPRNPAALAAAILDMLRDPRTAHELGAAARERALRLFGEDRFRAVHLAAYLALSPRHTSWRTHVWEPEGQEAGPIAVSGSVSLPVAEDAAAVALERDPGLLSATTHRPVDALEVAAALEADGHAYSHGEDPDQEETTEGRLDVFAVAEQLFAARAHVTWDEAEPAIPPVARLGSWLSGARVPIWNLCPPLAALALIVAAQSFGAVSSSTLVAVALGTGVGMAVSAPPALALGSLTGRLITGGRWRALTRILSATIVLTLVLSLAAAWALTLAPALPVAAERRPWLLAGASTSSVTWLLVGSASLLGAMGAAALVLLVVTVAFAVAIALLPVPGPTALAVLAVALPTLLLLALAAVRVSRDRGRVQRHETLPPLSFLAVGAAPALAYAALTVALLGGIHIAAWYAAGGFTVSLQRVEAVLLAALAPLVLAIALTERVVALGWQRAARAQRSLSSSATHIFATLTRRWHLTATAVLLVATSAAAVAVELAVRLNRTVADALAGAPAAILGPGLAAACLLGLAIADCLLMLSLHRAVAAMLPLVTGVVALTAATWIAAASGVSSLGWVLLIAALPALLVAEIVLHSLLMRADHTFYAAL
ncbi:MAG: GT4 family glycosyltransferase PelF [Actinomycetales bacterium]